MHGDPYLKDYAVKLEENQTDILNLISKLKQRVDSIKDRKEFKKLYKQVINLIELIRECDLFKIVMMNSLEREIKRSLPTFDDSDSKFTKTDVSDAERAKIEQNVNDGLNRLNNKSIDSHAARIKNLEDTISQLNEENQKIKEKYEEDFKKNEQKWEKKMKEKEREYQEEVKDKITEYVKRQRIVDTEVFSLEQQIIVLKENIEDLEKDKKMMCSYSSFNISKISSVLGINESFQGKSLINNTAQINL